MLEFKKIEIQDLAAISEIMSCMEKPVSVHWAGNPFLWQDYFETTFCISDGFLFLRSRAFDNESWGYLCPVGKGDMDKAMTMLREKAKADNMPLVIFSMYGEWLRYDDFVYLDNRSFRDYVYEREALATLGGKKLQAKRNHVNKFIKKFPDIKVREMQAGDRDDFINLTLKWAEGKEYPEGELLLLARLFDNFEALHGIIHGIAAYDGKKLVAFSLGGKINEDTFDVMMEKADKEYDGAFAFINRELAKSLPDEIKFMDREEDLGLPGLRKAKLSYHPVELRGYPTGVEKSSCMGQMFLLLKECFGDEDEFITKYLFYFSKPENRILIHDKNDKCHLNAMFNIHLFKGKIFEKTAYLYALAVKPEMRGKGLAVEAIRLSLLAAYERNCTIALTIQANKNFNAWQRIFDFGEYAPVPVKLQAPDEFDFGTGDKSSDIALCRILHVEEYLKTYALIHPGNEVAFNVKDDLFEQNNGYFSIADGKVVKTALKEDIPAVTVADIAGYCRVWDTELELSR